MPVLNQLEERIRETQAASRHRHASILSRFEIEVQRIGGVVETAAEAQSVGSSIAVLATARGIRRCQTTDADLATALNLEMALAQAGLDLVTGPTPESIPGAGIGITRAVLGIAETGSILVHLDEVDGRLLSMLPEMHVAVLPQDAIVDSLEEGLLFTRYLVLKSQARGLASYLSWVTGPSRTADIERVLTIGVHGPKELHIFLLPSTGEAR